jgi:hypothetical protein
MEATTTKRKSTPVIGRRPCKNPPVIEGRTTEFTIGPRRTLTAGVEADVHFPEKRKSYRRAKFMYAVGNTLVFLKPDTGGLVGVLPDKVGKIHRNIKLRGAE